MFSKNLLSRLEESRNLPHIEVTREEFIKLYLKNNGKDAELQANICQTMGSHMRIGSQMVKIK